MAERLLPTHYNKGRYRDRSDQRRPTFQILNAVQPKVHSHVKRDFYRYIEDPDPPYSGMKHDQDVPQLQARFVGVHNIPNKSCESVTSGTRTPACNFNGTTLRQNATGSNGNNRSHSAAPGDTSKSGRSRSQSPDDRVVMDESLDFSPDRVVWNPSKKTSRSNLLCPLTESEFRNFNSLEENQRIGQHHRKTKHRPRPSSVPPNHGHKKYVDNMHPEQETRNNGLLKVDNFCKEATELLEDFVAPPMSPSQISPSISLASTTYSMQISMVTQQLESIQQAQNDVLKHLGEEISRVTGENERLRKEVEHVRDQNDGLLKVVHDTTDELERMKQIFRIRHLPHPHSAEANHETGRSMIKPEAMEEHGSPKVIPLMYPHQHQRQRSTLEQPRSGGKRDSVNSNASHKPHSNLAGTNLLDDPEHGESPYHQHAPELNSKPPKGKKTERKNPEYGEGESYLMEEAEAINLVDDDNTSHISTESHTKGSGRRRSRHHSHSHHQHHSHKANVRNSNHEHHQPRGRSKDRGGCGKRNSKSPRSNNCYEPVDKQHTKHVVECNEDEYESGGGGCLNFFCCGSNKSSFRTDSADDMALRDGCPEK